MATRTTDSVETDRPRRVQTVSPRTVARVTGLLYLLVFVTAGFSEGYVRGTLVVPGDAAATAANVAASAWLFRLGVVSDLVAFSADAVIAVLLYVLLRPAGRTLALVAASLRLVAHPAIASINLLTQFVALQLLSGAAYLTAFEPEQLHALALLALTAHRYGYLIGGVFFGFHLLALGYLLFRSDRFPRVLGLLIAFAAVGGMGTILGPVGGAYLLIFLRDELFRAFLGPNARWVAVWSVVLVLLVTSPEGIFTRLWRFLGRIGEDDTDADVAATDGGESGGEPE